MKKCCPTKQLVQVNEAIRRITFGMKARHADDVKNLSQNEMFILYMVNKNPDLILKEIREFMQIPQTTLSSIVARLEKLGLVKRVINRRDLRSFSIEVTELGSKVIEEHKAMDLHIAEDILLALDDEAERCRFVELLEKVAQKIGIRC